MSCYSSSRCCEKTHLSPNTQTPAQCDAEHNRLYSTTRHNTDISTTADLKKKTSLVSSKAKCHIQNTEERAATEKVGMMKNMKSFPQNDVSECSNTHLFTVITHTADRLLLWFLVCRMFKVFSFPLYLVLLHPTSSVCTFPPTPAMHQ